MEERLLAVEIVNRSCRCCFKSFDSLENSLSEVTLILQDIFRDLINEEVKLFVDVHLLSIISN